MPTQVIAFPRSFRDLLIAYYMERQDVFSTPADAESGADHAIKWLSCALTEFSICHVDGDPTNPSSANQAAIFRALTRLAPLHQDEWANHIPTPPAKEARS